MPTDLDRLAGLTAGALPRLDGRQRTAAVAIYRLMAGGEAVTASTVARASGLSTADAAETLLHLPTASMERGRVTAFLGLQLAAGRHRVWFGDVGLSTWCAWDTLFLPALVGLAARVESACPATGRPIRLVVDPDAGVTRSCPQGAALSFLSQPEAFAGDVVSGFCRWVNFTAGAAAAEALAEKAGTKPGATSLITLSLADGVELGRRTNTLVFGRPG